MASSLTFFIVTLLSVGVSSFQDPQGWTTRSFTSSNDCMNANLNASFSEFTDVQTSKSALGKYGESIETDAYGMLVHVTAAIRAAGPRNEQSVDHTGCNLPFRSSVNDGVLPNEPWIALIKRGGCNFEIKVENAFLSKAAAVIVYDDKSNTILQKMKLSSPERNMSAVFTSKSYGEQLARLVDADTRVYMEIAVGTPCGLYNINRTSVLFVSISFIILMVISLAWLVFYYIQRFRYTHAKDKLSKRLGNAAKKALSRIPTKSVKSEDKEAQADGECCAVCIEPFKLSEVLRILPCKHEFHKSCIDPWLLEHRTCPMCKMDILKHYGFVFTGSQESILHLDVDENAASSNQNELASPTPRTPEPPVVSSLHHLDSSRSDSELDQPRSSIKLTLQNEASQTEPQKPDSEVKETIDK